MKEEFTFVEMPEKFDEKFADQVAELSILHFLKLGKTGKPKEETEWTLLACILQKDEEGLKVVSLGTGSKCIGASQLPKDGDVLHDSHAEVIARRAFVLYLIEQIVKAKKGLESVFGEKEGKFCLKDGVSFHFYTSHTPCGDASIFPKQEYLEEIGDHVRTPCTEQANAQYGLECASPSLLASSGHLGHSENEFERPAKILKKDESDALENTPKLTDKADETYGSSDGQTIEEKREMNCINKKLNNSEELCSDIHRTGAKTAHGEEEDPKMPGAGYHVTGALRTKPGRGDPTLSMSCSDKIFKWSVLGVQGALLMRFLKNPIYLETITIGSCPFSQEAMERALLGRFERNLEDIKLPEGFRVAKPFILSASVAYPLSRDSVTQKSSNPAKVMPSPTSLIWSCTASHREKHEVATNGRRHGITKKNIGTPKSWVSICRRSLLQRIQDVAQVSQGDTKDVADTESTSYRDIKLQSVSYYKAWEELKRRALGNWTVKPSFVKDFKA